MSPPSPLPTTSPSQPLTKRALSVRVRDDLRVVNTQHKYESAVVVKDPIALKYHRMRPDEYFVLQRLDGRHSLADIKQEYEQDFPPRKVSEAELNRLLFRFHDSGLTISDSNDQGARLADRQKKEKHQQILQSISGLLFIRFPGVDPDSFLRRIYPWLRPFFGTGGLLLATVIVITSLGLFLVRWNQFANEFPAMQQWLRFDSILMLAAVIGGTKVMHELGHALVCKHFGGECHQIGPMLLVFTPALYCDTSDSWMLTSRYARAAVGLAGIATEVLLAAIATIVWAGTAPGIVHYLAMNVMLVCGISTVVFNANPLLRYDGYYVLSDLWDIPNLGERSKRLLSSLTNRILLGVDEGSPESITAPTRTLLILYAVLAFLYRWTLTLVILSFVWIILRPYRLESVGRILCLIAVSGMLFALLRGPYLFLRHPSRRRKIQMQRLLISVTAFTSLVACCFLPLPAGISATAKIVPADETPIYITTTGTLEKLHRCPGERVTKGDVIATLSSPDAEMQKLKAEGRYLNQASVVDSIKQSTIDFPDASNDLPGQQSLLDDLATRLQRRTSQLEGLEIKASKSGRLISGPHRSHDTEAADQSRLVAWSGFATDDANRHCLLNAGTELMSIVTDDQWEAEITIAQSQVHRIQSGATVKIVLESLPAKPFFGTVTEISNDRWQQHRHTDRRSDPAAAGTNDPAETSFLVRVRLPSNTNLPLVTGSIAAARIETEKLTLAQRAADAFNGLFRFRN